MACARQTPWGVTPVLSPTLFRSNSEQRHFMTPLAEGEPPSQRTKLEIGPSGDFSGWVASPPYQT